MSTADDTRRGMELLVAAVATSVASQLDESGREAVLSAHRGFLDGAHADDGLSAEALRVAEAWSDLFVWIVDNFESGDQPP